MHTNELVSTYLTQSVANKSIAHAHLLVGTAHVDMLSHLLPVASLLLERDSEHHPDCTIIDTANTTITIDEIRNLRTWLGLSPLAANAKVAIIQHAERMNTEAQNALLKILEEPTPSTYIFLVASHKKQLLPTITSRCAIVYMHNALKNEQQEAPEKKFFDELVEKNNPAERLHGLLERQFEKEMFPALLPSLTQSLRSRLLKTHSKQIAETLYTMLDASHLTRSANWQLIIERALISF